MLEVYSMRITEAEHMDESFCLSTFPKRTERSKKYYKNEDKLRCIGAGALMFYALGANERDISTDNNGKPYLIDNSVEFSVSHGGDFSVIAKANCPVGIDVEKISDNHLDIAKNVYQDEELYWMNGDREKFYILWTLKESVMKLIGTGLSMGPKSFSVLPLINGNCIEQDLLSIFGKYEIMFGHVISLCSTQKIDHLQVIHVTADQIKNKPIDELII